MMEDKHTIVKLQCDNRTENSSILQKQCRQKKQKKTEKNMLLCRDVADQPASCACARRRVTQRLWPV